MQRNCPKCNAPANDDLPGGLCPSCLLAAARKPRAQASQMTQRSQIVGMSPVPGIDELSAQFPELDIIELVGQGGMGAVYKARQRELDRIVALKIFLYRSHDPEFAERFRREARALGKLSHPNIVTVHTFGIRQGIHFLVMEFVDGLNLRQVTQEERLAPGHAMQLIPELCDALQYAHDQGVVHRDIKPENILLDASGRIKIADFGLAKMAEGGIDAGLTHTQQVMGTWNYMAPEQRERPTEVDHRADIYSLGVVIYEMLTGELPLGRFQAPSEKVAIDARLDEVVMRALEKEPERRYQKASEFKTGFTSYAQAAPAVANVAAATMSPAPPVKSAAPDLAQPEQGMRLHACIMSGREKRGRWQVGDPNIMFTMMGGSVLDLTDVQARNVNIVSFVLMGGAEIIVPPGATVDIDGLVIMGATTDKVNYNEEPVDRPMRVRIRSFGMMGGCEVRSSRKKTKKKKPRPTSPVKSQPEQFRLWPNVALFLTYAIAWLVTLAVPIMFVSSGLVYSHDQENFKLAGIVAAIAAGMLWVMVGHVRTMFVLPAADASDSEIEEMQDATRTGTLVRMIATVVVFACPILFIINSFNNDDREMKLAAIVCAIVGGALFILAGQVDEFMKRMRDERTV